jgi:uncharacterized protein
MKQLDPKAVWLFFISFVLWWFALAILFMLTIMFTPIIMVPIPITFSLTRLWIIISALLIGCFVWAKFAYRFYRYELLDTGFRKESGVIYKKYVTIPYDRIQNVDINRGILARILGLSDLNIQTAGASAAVSRYGVMGGGAEGRLPGVSMEVAEQLRDELIQRARQSKNQGL